MRAALLEPGDPRWAEVLAGVPHDVYHLPEYLAMSAAFEGGEARALLAEDGEVRLLAPLLLRPLPAALEAPAEWRDALTPYGYPAPLLAGDGAAERLAPLLEAALGEAAAAGVVTAFFRLHPLLPLPHEAEVLPRLGEVVEHGETVAVDLSLPAEQHWSQTRGNHRTGINRLRKQGFQVRVDDWSLFSDFRRIYAETMERVGAGGFYFFSDAYFEALRRSLGERLHLFAVLSPEGEVACAGLFPAVEGVVQYHLGGTAPAFLGVAPSKLMFDAVRNWGREAGLRWLHLGGGVGGARDSLFNFKAGFSPVHLPFRTFRVVLDAGRETELVRRRDHLAGGAGAAPGFFPRYRAAPLPSLPDDL